jgi:hypothetical protein
MPNSATRYSHRLQEPADTHTYTRSGIHLPETSQSLGNGDDERRARRSYALLRAGEEGHENVFFTLTKGRDLGLELRTHRHLVLTRAKRRWPDCEAATVYEYSPQRGAHLHVVMKNAPGFQVVYDAEGLARYLTKQMRDRLIVDGWPRYFRPITTTRRWCPGWLSRAEWAAHTPEGRRSAARRVMDRELPIESKETCS